MKVSQLEEKHKCILVGVSRGSFWVSGRNLRGSSMVHMRNIADVLQDDWSSGGLK